MHDADQCLPGGERTDHLLADRLLAHGSDEVLDHRQGHVGFEQRHAHFAQGIGDVVFGQSCLTAQRLDDAAQTLREVVEHLATSLG